MPIRLSKTQAKQYGLPVKNASKRPARRADGYASQLEADYAQVLRHDSMVRLWQYEAIRLILAPKTTYLPDFLVVTAKGTLEIHEVKGFLREKDNVKVKVAARLFPMFRFFLVRKLNGLWDYQAIHS